MGCILNNVYKTSIGFDFTNKIFGIYASYGTIAFISIGIYTGISYIKSPGLYGIMLIFLI
jgi:hypothetical protein